MPKLTAKNFFTPDETQRIEAAVREAESRTSGEIVPLVVDESYHYPRAEIVGGGFFALGLGVLAAWSFGHSSVWAFLPVFLLTYLPLRWLIRALPGLKRRLIHPAEMVAEVEEKALVAFLEHRLYQTRDATGVLILISLFERRVRVLADSGISTVVPQQEWDGIVATITAGIRAGKTCDALCTAIGRCGDLLAERFPCKTDDTDELPNLITE
jgi:putative membrane protein